MFLKLLVEIEGKNVFALDFARGVCGTFQNILGFCGSSDGERKRLDAADDVDDLLALVQPDRVYGKEDEEHVDGVEIFLGGSEEEGLIFLQWLGKAEAFREHEWVMIDFCCAENVISFFDRYCSHGLILLLALTNDQYVDGELLLSLSLYNL